MLYNSAAHHSFLWQQRFLGPWNSFTHAAIFKSTEFGLVSPEVEELLGLHVHVCQVLHVCYKSINTLLRTRSHGTLWSMSWVMLKINQYFIENQKSRNSMANVMSYILNQSVLHWEPKPVFPEPYYMYHRQTPWTFINLMNNDCLFHWLFLNFVKEISPIKW